MLRRCFWFVLFFVGLYVCAWGCGGWTTYDEYKCSNPNTTITYNNFVKGFLDKWCNYCHSVTSENRRGAPIAYVFDTYASVVALKKRIFLRSAANNITMPPGPDDPPLEERNKLAEWIVCGTPR
ncbi:MAG: hypothetical protein EP343_25775 [Deltaproteobacteria bacterium]|nr:MAG: hypothetical protein EP343_25775 [Deltaproteobacteria bacterium]